MSYRSASAISHDYILSVIRFCTPKWGFSAQRDSVFFFIRVVHSVEVMFSFWPATASFHVH